MSKRTDKDLLVDILEAAKRIMVYGGNISYADFMKDNKTQDAVIRNLEVIGEAAKNISAGLREKYPGTAWKDMARIRDRLIHHYFGVNLDILWAVIEESLPAVISDIANTHICTLLESPDGAVNYVPTNN